MKKILAALVIAASALAISGPADAAPKAPAKKVAVKKAVVKKAVVKKAVVKKADPCSPAEVAKVNGVKPFKAEGLTFVRTDVFKDSGYNAGSPTPRRWVNYRGPQVWLSTAVCGTIYRQVFIYSDGSTSSRF